MPPLESKSKKNKKKKNCELACRDSNDFKCGCVGGWWSGFCGEVETFKEILCNIVRSMKCHNVHFYIFYLLILFFSLLFFSFPFSSYSFSLFLPNLSICYLSHLQLLHRPSRSFRSSPSLSSPANSHHAHRGCQSRVRRARHSRCRAGQVGRDHRVTQFRCRLLQITSMSGFCVGSIEEAV